MSKLVLVAFKDLRKIAEAAGFEFTRRSGSHCAFTNKSGSIIVIPDHGSQVILRP